MILTHTLLLMVQTMKLVHHRDDSRYTLAGHGRGFILVNQERYHTPLLLSPSRIHPDWVKDFSSLDIVHFETILDLKPELVLFGSGNVFRFPPLPLTQPLIDHGIGLEVMDTAAACRTYTVLASEGRQVVAALIVEP